MAVLDTYGLRHSEIIMAKTRDELRFVAWLIREDQAFEADYTTWDDPVRNLTTLRELFHERWVAKGERHNH